ncbi:hypothetical protein BMI86_05505 [Thioclava sp. DLFJ5-1]|nr:hypothetical protein BMI86_05505 [Thioclava sp. DLFJ5-1]
MDQELTSGDKRIDDMSFKDLTTRAAAALKPTPEKTAKPSAEKSEPKAASEAAPAKSKTS